MNDPGEPGIASPRKTDFALRCVSIDLEVSTRGARIQSFAAVRGDTGHSFTFPKGNLTAALAQLDDFAAGADFLLGHNIIDFDLKHLAAAKPDLHLLKLPSIDTLLLNPLTSPRNPYHGLVKHYKDAQLIRRQLNDPELDAQIALRLFRDQLTALASLEQTAPELVLAWHWLTTLDAAGPGFDSVFSDIRGRPRPTDTAAISAIGGLLSRITCSTHAQELLIEIGTLGWELAYTLAWLSVASTNSVMPPWVRLQFPRAITIVKRLRDGTCTEPDCLWCREHHDAQKELRRWFDFGSFRPEPRDSEGRPLQQVIVEAAMRGEHVLGILPTGTGKSVCYQVPALSRFENTGALTVVISPLVALMADQVASLRARGITACAAINGLLSMPERAVVLEEVRLGDIGILLISPEQLRSRTVRRAIAQREIGGWVIDEAHCISKWGHDFRPDYRYIGRFIKENLPDHLPVPPVMCLTATAKPDVVADILDYFREKLEISLTGFDGGAVRTNLDFVVLPTTAYEKFAHIHQVIEHDLPPETPGGAIVYCSTRRQTEEVAEFLQANGFATDHFHGRLTPDRKRRVQERFIAGESRVIVATNAFGMGLDKPDVRLVLHADVPGSLENYVQEAGRAGRDLKAARCVLLYAHDDVERQFSMSARSRLTRFEIQAVLKSLKNLDRRRRMNGEIVATAGEILAEDSDRGFERDAATDDTRVRTAVAWLEEAKLLERHDNHVQIFPSSLRVRSVNEARRQLEGRKLVPGYQAQLLSIVEKLMTADSTEGISTDEFGMSVADLRHLLYDLERLEILSNDTVVTAFVHTALERSSKERYEELARLEKGLIDQLEQAAPELEVGEAWPLHLRVAAQRLRDAGHTNARPDNLRRIMEGLSKDGRGDGRGSRSVHLSRIDSGSINVKLGRKWPDLRKTADLRRDAAGRLLEHFLKTLPPEVRGADLLATTTISSLHDAIKADLILMSEVRDPVRLIDHALMWLHDHDIIRLNKGLAVFRSAMTIRMDRGRRSFAKGDFAPLQVHYNEHTVQIHVMAEYAQRGLGRMAEALEMVIDYFTEGRNEFMKRWLPNREKEVLRQTTMESWRDVVESLSPVQQKIVADEREQTNILVLAGPGSGKTRVLVHRIAFLVRVKRENPNGILALAYNRHAAVEIRKRLATLIADDAKGVTVLTCHALAMRLIGVSFAGLPVKGDDERFKQVLKQATALLNGEDLFPEEADERRDRLLSGFRWILVDEYQDIGSDQYELISALAGRTQQDEDRKLNLFAVGDDDQNIYEFAGASVEFIRRFENDFSARAAFLTENYRSSAGIIDAANTVIGGASDRMKADKSLVIDAARKREPRGGDWERLDPVGKGRVQIIAAGNDSMTQAVAVMAELLRLSELDSGWNWAKAAVIAREWKYLHAIHAYCELNDIPVQMADEETPLLWRLRETRQLIEWLHTRESPLVDAAEIASWVKAAGVGPWWLTLLEAVEAYGLETGDATLPTSHFEDWLAEWGREMRRRQNGLLLLTAHRAKGLEFDHVVVLDGGWQERGGDKRDAERRLYYVAMTRARKTLTLASFDRVNRYLRTLDDHSRVVRRERAALPAPPRELAREYKQLTMSEVDLGFAGRYAASHRVHEAIARLSAGDEVQLRQRNGRWEIVDGSGIQVGRLSRKFTLPVGKVCVSARVAAIVRWAREDSEIEYRDLVRCESWEVVLPDLVFEPEK